MSLRPAKANTWTIEGKLVMFIFIDPNSFVILTDKQGAQWTVEWNSARVLRRQGVAPDTLKPGDHVVVVGEPTQKEHGLHLVSIMRPSDSWEWHRRR